MVENITARVSIRLEVIIENPSCIECSIRSNTEMRVGASSALRVAVIRHQGVF